MLKKEGCASEKAELLIKRWKPSLVKSSLSGHFPVSQEEAEDLDELEAAFPDMNELRMVLEDYFGIYEENPKMSPREFDACLADYFHDNCQQEQLTASRKQ